MNQRDIQESKEGGEQGESKCHHQPCLIFPDDILRIIFSRLDLVDRIRMRMVCKDWRRLMSEIPYQLQGKSPWILSYDIRDMKYLYARPICKLTDPVSKKTYIIKISNEARKLFLDAISCASKFGWVLLSQRVPNHGSKRQSLCFWRFFVYCPFNNKFIKLPRWDGDSYTGATFSTDPTSPDCIFFIFEIKGGGSLKALISICRIGDKKWTKLKFHVPEEYNSDIHPWGNWEVAYENGLFYTVSVTGLVGVFDVKLQEWKLLTSSSQFRFARTCYVIVSQEELFMVRKFKIYYGFIWMMWRFDMVQKQWVEEEKCNWENQVLFLGCTSFSAEAVGELSTYANMIYFECDRPNYYSSLSSGEIDFDYRFFGRVISKTKCGKTWIQPPIFFWSLARTNC
ncbi:F-box protein At1g49360-like [Hevea brasiliensis]|uniref:F-box protein At1g49360-like n=1 Tax=Hevea brasiliensis TaxID=3981 RepID=UPI0025DAB11D|nr:F-box protein At1g49360-like [Hevea brasiliensis]